MIPARPTTYKGIQMRSRTEAAWAAHFDQSGWEWRYEPQCFASQEGQYLPDFQLLCTRWPTYVEIKGAVATRSDMLSVLTRMQIIHASEPLAILLLYVGMPDGHYGYHCCVHDGWKEFKHGSPSGPSLLGRPPSALGAHRRSENESLAGVEYPAGTMNAVMVLDNLDAPQDITFRQARELLKCHGESRSNVVLAAAVSFRRRLPAVETA